MYDFVANSLRGGLSVVHDRYCESTATTKIAYFDVNNLCKFY